MRPAMIQAKRLPRPEPSSPGVLGPCNALMRYFPSCGSPPARAVLLANLIHDGATVRSPPPAMLSLAAVTARRVIFEPDYGLRLPVLAPQAPPMAPPMNG